MAQSQDAKTAFLDQLTSQIHENLADEDFGVSELAQAMNMSRSSLLRKVKQQTQGDSASVFIRRVRLAEAKKLLQDESTTVSEVAFQVGFNSTSYFTRCFREEYGYPPGEERKRQPEEPGPETPQITPHSIRSLWQRYTVPVVFVLGVILLIVLFIFPPKAPSDPTIGLEKSIAVLPFKNDSGDSSNIYIINGLMEAILNDLQKIEDLKVISRTTVEKYRHQSKSIPELSEELRVNYFIEGSGQKMGDQIVLSIQVIEATQDQHIWSERYEREAKSIFQLQTDIALEVAHAIKAMITPEELQRIQKRPTQNTKAYDYYLEGLGKMSERNAGSLQEAITLFQKAIQEDEALAQAYGYIGVCYYYLDVFQVNKKHAIDINTHADKALLLDPELGPGLIAKALYYMQDEQYALAIQFLEKVLDYYPNDAWVHNFLSDIYANYLLNTEKYLTHAIQGIRQTALDQDSINASYSYLHLANALAQSGFIVEAEPYIRQSLSLNPHNIFSETLYAYIELAKDFDLATAKSSLIQTLEKDSNNILVVQEIAKLCYFMKDYETAWGYYEKFLQIKETLNWDVYAAEHIKIAFVLQQLGRAQQAVPHLDIYLKHLQEDSSNYRELSYSAYSAIRGKVDEGIEHLRNFSQQQNLQFWFILFLEDDPIMRQLAAHPAYQSSMDKIKAQFWKQHQQVKKNLIEKGVLAVSSLESQSL